MTSRLEHANLVVRDIDGMIRFIQAALPDFRIRHDETEPDGSRWVHIGSDDFYLTLNNASEQPAENWVPYSGKPGVNHLGFEVEDAEAVRKRLNAAGYPDSTYPNAHPYRKRVYFNDPEGNDWEFVQYLSDDPAKRNDYSLPG
ncbi:MAG TPA: VOC family protein [Xanthomonadales bacterium]|nr:VOC family protein [Xanthomonadales bacterium]